jgi:hypothetical protein
MLLFGILVVPNEGALAFLDDRAVHVLGVGPHDLVHKVEPHFVRQGDQFGPAATVVVEVATLCCEPKVLKGRTEEGREMV